MVIEDKRSDKLVGNGVISSFRSGAKLQHFQDIAGQFITQQLDDFVISSKKSPQIVGLGPPMCSQFLASQL